MKGLLVGTAAPVPTPKIVGQRVSTSRYMVSIFGSKEMRVAQVPVLPGTPLVRVRAITLFGGVTVVSKTHRSDGIE